MTDLRVTTTRGTDIVLNETIVQGFQTSLRGPLLRPGDAGYDEARTVWNANVDKRPALIARCAGVSDVINAVSAALTPEGLVALNVQSTVDQMSSDDIAAAWLAENGLD